MDSVIATDFPGFQLTGLFKRIIGLYFFLMALGLLFMAIHPGIDGGQAGFEDSAARFLQLMLAFCLAGIGILFPMTIKSRSI